MSWQQVALSDIATAKKGKKPKTLFGQPAEGRLPYIDIKAFEKGVIRQYAEAADSSVVNPDQILVVWDGARSGLVGRDCAGALGSTLAALQVHGADLDYVFRFLQSKYDEINSRHKGTGIPHVDPEVFWSLELPLPPMIEQQRRIVARLDKITARLDEVKARLDTIPATLKRFRQSILAAAFTGRLTGNWRSDNPMEDAAALLRQIVEARSAAAERETDKRKIKEFSDGFEPVQGEEAGLPPTWMLTHVGMIGSVCNGSTPSRKDDSYWGGKIHWVSSGEVRNGTIASTREFITQAGYENSAVRLLSRGTVLVAMIGEGKTRGQTAILDIEACINQNIAAVIIDHGMIEPKYLWLWFLSQYEITRQAGSGSGPQALNCQRVRELSFVLAPILEQREIVRRVEALFKQADAIEARYKKARIFVEKLTPSVLAKAFRGELG